MDPKSVNNLDPKMKETYDRVMGTTTPPAAGTTATTPQATPAPATPNPLASPPASAPTTPAANAPFTSSPSMPDNLQFQAAIQTPPSQPAAAPIGAIPGRSSSLLKILYVVGSIVFFVAYTFFWIKIFNILFLSNVCFCKIKKFYE
jgi:hypothetical protein